jgi:hypothetical protein
MLPHKKRDHSAGSDGCCHKKRGITLQAVTAAVAEKKRETSAGSDGCCHKKRGITLQAVTAAATQKKRENSAGSNGCCHRKRGITLQAVTAAATQKKRENSAGSDNHSPHYLKKRSRPGCDTQEKLHASGTQYGCFLLLCVRGEGCHCLCRFVAHLYAVILMLPLLTGWS